MVALTSTNVLSTIHETHPREISTHPLHADLVYQDQEFGQRDLEGAQEPAQEPALVATERKRCQSFADKFFFSVSLGGAAFAGVQYTQENHMSASVGVVLFGISLLSACIVRKLNNQQTVAQSANNVALTAIGIEDAVENFEETGQAVESVAESLERTQAELERIRQDFSNAKEGYEQQIQSLNLKNQELSEKLVVFEKQAKAFQSFEAAIKDQAALWTESGMQMEQGIQVLDGVEESLGESQESLRGSLASFVALYEKLKAERLSLEEQIKNLQDEGNKLRDEITALAGIRKDLEAKSLAMEEKVRSLEAAQEDWEQAQQELSRMEASSTLLEQQLDQSLHKMASCLKLLKSQEELLEIEDSLRDLTWDLERHKKGDDLSSLQGEMDALLKLLKKIVSKELSADIEPVASVQASALLEEDTQPRSIDLLSISREELVSPQDLQGAAMSPNPSLYEAGEAGMDLLATRCPDARLINPGCEREVFSG